MRTPREMCPLTAIERQILDMVLAGKEKKDIAKELGKSIDNITARLRFAWRKAEAQGLIDDQDEDIPLRPIDETPCPRCFLRGHDLSSCDLLSIDGYAVGAGRGYTMPVALTRGEAARIKALATKGA